MDGNKEEASRCLRLAEAALSSGNRERAIRFAKFAKRLNPGLNIDDLIAALSDEGSQDNAAHKEDITADQFVPNSMSCGSSRCSNGDRGYTEEHVSVIRSIKRNKDYYAILGVERNCSVEEIRRAYRKLSLKVHPDKNKAPGAEEAFKSVSRAFKCLSEEQSRQVYDQTGIGEDYEPGEPRGSAVRRRHARRRRTSATSGFYYYDEDFDPDEIFRSFFFGTHDNMYRASNVYRHQREHAAPLGTPFNYMMLVHFVLILLITLFAFIPSQQPGYSLHKTSSYPIPKVTEKHGVEFFVRNEDFDVRFPHGGSSRYNLEDHVLRDYKVALGRHCQTELQRRQWTKNYPTPHCEKLRSLM